MSERLYIKDAKPTPDPHCPHCEGTGRVYQDVWLDECICVWEKWADVIRAETIKQIMETSDEDAVDDNWPAIVKSATDRLEGDDKA